MEKVENLLFRTIIFVYNAQSSFAILRTLNYLIKYVHKYVLMLTIIIKILTKLINTYVFNYYFLFINCNLRNDTYKQQALTSLYKPTSNKS